MTEENIQTPRGSTPSSEEKEGKAKKWIVRIILLLILLLLLLLLLYQCGYLGKQEVDSSTDYIIGAGVKEGALDNGSEEGDSESGAGSNGKANMTVRMNGYPVFADGESEGNLNIVNPEENLLYLKVEIRLDDTNELIYESGAIPPNHHVDNDKLTKVLEQGEYNATAHVTLFDPDNSDSTYNSANFALVITIEN